MTTADIAKVRRFTAAALAAFGRADGFSEVQPDDVFTVAVAADGLVGSFAHKSWGAADFDGVMEAAHAWLATVTAKRISALRVELDEELRRHREAEAILADHEPEPNPRQK